MAEPRIFNPTVTSLSELATIQGDDRCVLAVYFPGEVTKGRKAREERRLRDAIVNEHGAGGHAVVGPADTLAALKQNRIRRLLIGPLEDTAFWRCGNCGNCGLGDPVGCPDCNGATYAQSAANEFTDLAYAAGSRVEFTNDELPELDGVGGLLRW